MQAPNQREFHESVSEDKSSVRDKCQYGQQFIIIFSIYFFLFRNLVSNDKVFILQN